MVDLIPKNTGKFESSGIGDAFLIGVVKAIEERTLINYIGNGTVKSGAIKGIGGAVISNFIPGKAGKIVGSAFAIDAVEDAVNGLMSMTQNSNENNDNW